MYIILQLPRFALFTSWSCPGIKFVLVLHHPWIYLVAMSPRAVLRLCQVSQAAGNHSWPYAGSPPTTIHGDLLKRIVKTFKPKVKCSRTWKERLWSIVLSSSIMRNSRFSPEIFIQPFGKKRCLIFIKSKATALLKRNY